MGTLVVYNLLLDEDTQFILFNDRTILEMMPDEETTIETEGLEDSFGDS